MTLPLRAAFAMLLVQSAPSFAQGAPPDVTVAQPLVREIVESDEFIGRFEAVDRIDIRARVSGYVASVEFADGAFMEAGTLLAVIDQAPYRAALEEAQARVAAADAQVEFARSDLERASALTRSGSITAQLADTRQQSFAIAQAEARAARAALDRAMLDMRYTEIRAPISGRMSQRRVSAGDLVAADSTVVSNIVSTDPVHFYFDVDERSFLAYRDLDRGGLNAPAAGERNEVRLAVGDEPTLDRPGHVDFTDNRLDAASGTMRARVVAPNPDGDLVPGLFGRVVLAGSRPYEAVMVPDEAVASDQNRRIVYVVDEENRVAARPVTLGPRIDGYRVVREGLTGDESVVVNGLIRVRPGITVAPRSISLPSSPVASVEAR